MNDRKLTYVIAAHGYDPNVGGIIFQHELAKTLLDEGHDVWLWPEPPLHRPSLKDRLRQSFKPKRDYRTLPGMEDRVTRGIKDPETTVVVYPETILGNPLGAKHVVRWLLYKPGLRHPFEFGPDEMFFRAGKIADIPEITGGAPDLFSWKLNPAYRNENRPDRKGVCYMVRKGADKPRIPATEAADSILIGRQSHQTIADIFNSCEAFYSYDEATMYSQFAAICGCDSIVVPGMFETQDDWVAQHPNGKYGIAYGAENLPHARATRHKVEPLMKEREAESLSTIRRFVALTHERFSP